MTSLNACPQKGHSIEAAWKVLERGLFGWESVSDRVSGRDAEMEFGVKMFTRIHSCERKEQKSLGGPGVVSTQQWGALKQVCPIRSHPHGPDAAFVPHPPQLWNLIRLGRWSPLV